MANAKPDPTMPSYYSPSETALLLIDFYSLFVERVGLSGANALSTAVDMRNWAKQCGMHVIHCLIDITSQPAPTTKGVERLASILASMKSNDGHMEPAALFEDSEDDVQFTRRIGHVSGLKSPGLENFLQEKGVKSLVVTGLSTSGCVLRTAAAGCDADFVVSVIEDACADREQDVHDALVGKVLRNRGYVYKAATFQAEMESRWRGE